MNPDELELTTEDFLYWENFYAEQRAPESPSDFALSVFESYLFEGCCLLEFGCGNGRDSKWFASKGLTVWALDQSSNATSELDDSANVKIINQSLKQFVDNDEWPEDVEFVYSRFFLHSIIELECERLFDFIGRKCVPGTVCMHEFRVSEDMKNFEGRLVSSHELVTDHYRRFINFADIVDVVNTQGWEILEARMGQGFAIHGDEDPVVGRLAFKIT